MPVIAVNILVVLATVVAMECVAWLSHRYIMHGAGWAWHASHHAPTRSRFEKNDLFALFFAAIAIVLIYAGTSGWWPLQWVGAGMTLYGALYAIAHDGMVHRRWPFPYVPRQGYLKRLYQAHRLHHVSQQREHGIFFGFLLAPSERQLREAVLRVRQARQASQTIQTGPAAQSLQARGLQ